MFLSAKAFFDDHTQSNIRLLIRAETALPVEFVKRYKKNVAKITPKKTGALRRSIITQITGSQANISWRSPYAKAQNEGGHTVPRKVTGPNKRDGGFGVIMPLTYRYTRYTTAGTGPKFATRAFMTTNNEMQSVLRELGLTK